MAFTPLVGGWSRHFARTSSLRVVGATDEGASPWTDLVTLLASSGMASLVFWSLDLASWSPLHLRPLAFSAALEVAVGIASGFALAPIWLFVRLATRSEGRRGHVAASLAAACLAFPAAKQVLEARRSATAHPRAAAFALGVGAVVVLLGSLGWALARARNTRASGRLTAALALTAIVLLVVDAACAAYTIEKAYSFVEGAAHVTLTMLGIAVAPNVTRTSSASLARALRPALRLVLLAGAGWTVLFFGSEPLRIKLEAELAPFGKEAYAARWVRRVRRIDTLGGGTSPTKLLVHKHALDDGLDETWEARDLARARVIAEPQEATRPWNIAVFFVDTLRADVASDPLVMPQTAAWAKQNLSFTNTYASGSSTLLTLAPMLGCRYDRGPTEAPPRLLAQARAAGLTTALVIPKSAAEYHRTFFPGFRFDHEDVVVDLDGGRLPTASETVARSLAWLERERPDSFLLWLYEFDVHSWGDLDEGWVSARAEEGGFSRTEGLPWRYRAAARGVDAAFTEFRAGLERLGIADRTVIVFVSDHGEGLGQQRDFWAHSTYLWESLVRVPLAIQVPDAEPGGLTIDTPVSTVDLGTTLARLLPSPADEAGCHGEDLLAPDSLARRRYPILFSAMVDGWLARVGMLDGGGRKIVVDVRDGDARLLRVGGGDELDVSDAEPDALVSQLGLLVRTPIYPRP